MFQWPYILKRNPDAIFFFTNSLQFRHFTSSNSLWFPICLNKYCRANLFPEDLRNNLEINCKALFSARTWYFAARCPPKHYNGEKPFICIIHQRKWEFLPIVKTNRNFAILGQFVPFLLIICYYLYCKQQQNTVHHKSKSHLTINENL